MYELHLHRDDEEPPAPLKFPAPGFGQALGSAARHDWAGDLDAAMDRMQRRLDELLKLSGLDPFDPDRPRAA